MIRSADDVALTAAELRSWRIDGAVILGTFTSDADEVQARLAMPLVFVDNYSTSSQIQRVGIDDFKGGLLAGRHLLAAGHRRLALVAPGVDQPGVIQQRYAGFCAALDEVGMPLDRLTLIDCEPFFDDGVALGRELAARPERPTGIFATADIIAIGLLKGLLEAGLAVPEDVSLVGFDDLPEARYVNPSLTTVRQDIPAKAEASVQTLLGMMEGAPVGETVCLDVELSRRGSVATLPA
jgi:LacI family transcriptional regulator